MLWDMNLHVLHRPSLQRVIFGGEEGEVLGVLTSNFTHEGITKVARAAVGKKRIFKGIFSAIRGRKNRIIFLMILLKFGSFGLQEVINTVRLLDFLCWQ